MTLVCFGGTEAAIWRRMKVFVLIASDDGVGSASDVQDLLDKNRWKVGRSFKTNVEYTVGWLCHSDFLTKYYPYPFAE